MRNISEQHENSEKKLKKCLTNRMAFDKISFAAEKAENKTKKLEKFSKKYLTRKRRFDKIIFATDR